MPVLLLFPFEGILGSAAHPQQKLIVHLDDMIERRLQGFDQKTRHHRVAFGFRHAAQMPDVLAARVAREL